jgi:hypothetical protein
MNCQIHEPLGRCCCNCRWQLAALAHPWNKGFAKGRVTEVIGWLCTEPTFLEGETPGAVFSDSKHGLCEMHEVKVIEETK